MSRVYSDFLKGCARIAGAMDGRAVEVLVEEELETHLREDRQTVLWVGARYDYGNRDWGLSFEHYSFFHTLMHMGYSLIYFDYDRLFQRYGRRRLSEILRGAVYYYEPTILLYFHYLDWIDHDVFREISLDLPTKTVVWLADDHWRYEETRPVWKLFNTVVTTSIDGYERRRSEGFTGVVLGQWGCNHFLYRRMNVEKQYDISFIGRFYGERGRFIETLSRSGVSVATFGQGWKGSDRVSQAELVNIFNRSRISLNISAGLRGETVQVKGRDFEAPGCGSVLLTRESRAIGDFFIPGEEILTYTDAEDAAKKVRYYLSHEEELQKIAENGYMRVLSHHTMEERINNIFDIIDNK